jgi:hypothetical protein
MIYCWVQTVKNIWKSKQTGKLSFYIKKKVSWSLTKYRLVAVLKL